MFKRILFSLSIVAATFLLSGCNDQAAYIALIKNQTQLQKQLQTCKQEDESLVCQRARSVAQALTLFAIVQHVEAQNYPNEAQAMQHYQQLVEQAAKSKQLKQQIQSELAGVDQFYLAVAEGYAKQIMAQETRLSQLKQQRDKATSSSEKKKLARQITQTRMLVEAMLALVNVNSGGQ